MANADIPPITELQLRKLTNSLGIPVVKRVSRTVTAGGTAKPEAKPHAWAVFIPIVKLSHALTGRRGARREWQDLNRLEVALREMGFTEWVVVNEMD